MTNGYDLSRRKVLLGLGTIGAAGAGAGLGTSAYFSDEERFEDNTIEAGTFSMEVELLDDATVDQDGMGPDEDDWYTRAEGENAMVGASLDINDLKPGDTYEFCWCIKVYDNPGVVRALIPEDSVSDEDGETAGNVDADNIHDVDEGEFVSLLDSEHITVSKNMYVDCHGEEIDEDNQVFEEDITYEYDGDYDWGGGFGNWVSSLSNRETSSQDGLPIGSHDGVGSRNDNIDDEDLDEGEADYILIGGDDDGDPVTGADYASVAYCVEIDVSTDAGNELQGAELSFDLEFHAEQARHNDHPFSDWATRPTGDGLDDWSDLPV